MIHMANIILFTLIAIKRIIFPRDNNRDLSNVRDGGYVLVKKSWGVYQKIFMWFTGDWV